MVIYKTINLINGKYYIGKDSKNCKTYLGSGLAIKKAIQKYGKGNFKKEILYTYNNLKELNKKEIEIINENVLNDPNSYNLSLGGQGGNLSKFRKSSRKGKKWEEIFGKNRANKLKREHSKKLSGSKNGMFGKKHSTESKIKMSKSLQGLNKGKKLSENTKEKIRKRFKNRSYEDRFGKERSLEIRAKLSKSHKNRNRKYEIHQIDNEKNILNKFSTIQEAINKLNISRKKAYNNSFSEFKFIKIENESI